MKNLHQQKTQPIGGVPILSTTQKRVHTGLEGLFKVSDTSMYPDRFASRVGIGQSSSRIHIAGDLMPEFRNIAEYFFTPS
jgi:hypothetical protein